MKEMGVLNHINTAAHNMRELRSKHIEENVISCLFLAPEEHHLYFDSISADDFDFKETRAIFEILQEYFDDSKAITADNIADEYVFRTGEEAADEYVLDIAFKQATSGSIESDVEALLDLSKKRQLIKTCDYAIQEGSKKRADIDEIISGAEKSLQEISMQVKDSKIKHYKDAMKGAIETIQGVLSDDKDSIGYSTGFINLDRIATLRKGEMIVIGARPSIGKSSICGNIAHNLSKQGINTYLGTLEMKAEQFLTRLLYQEIGANQYTIKTLSRNELSTKLTQVIDKASEANIWFDDVGRDWNGIKRRIRRAHKNVGIQVAMIDYLQLIQIKASPGEKFFSRENQVATISGEIKALALELDIPIVILAQLNRDNEGNIPKMSNLRESGAIEQDADQIWLLHRERETDNDELKGAERIQAVLSIPKNRNGRTGLCDLWFHPGTTEFRDRMPEFETPNI